MCKEYQFFYNAETDEVDFIHNWQYSDDTDYHRAIFKLEGKDLIRACEDYLLTSQLACYHKGKEYVIFEQRKEGKL